MINGLKNQKLRTCFKVLVLGLSLLTLVFHSPVQAQTGPGGVGATDGSSSLNLWLDANQGVSTSGSSVTQWNDISGKGNNVSQGTSAKQPTFQSTSSINSGPAIRFDGVLNDANGDELTAIDGTTLDNFSGLSIFMVHNPSAVDGSPRGLISKRNSPGNAECYSMFFYTGNNWFMDIPGSGSSNRENTSESFAAGSTYLMSMIFNGSAQSVSAYESGTAQTMNDGSVSVNSIPNQGSSLSVGHLRGNNTGYFEGDIAEVVLFGSNLNGAQQTIVENYLSTKYSISISNDKYAFDALYGTDIAGLGRESDGNHLSANSSDLNLSLSSVSADGDYVLFGHDSGNATNLTTISGDNFRDDATNTLRLAREWKVDFSGAFSDAVDISFDTSNVSTGRPSDEWDWVLFIDQNGDGDFVDAGDSFVDLTINGSSVEASGVSLTDNATLTLGAIKREVQFATSASQGIENVTQFPTLTVEINYPYSDGTSVNFSYSVAAGTAQAGDFNTNRTSAIISSGTSSVDLNNGAGSGDAAIDVVNDGSIENTETVTVTISSATNASIGTQNVHTYSILDDDEPRKIDFNSATLSQPEGSSGNYTLSLQFDLTSTSATTITTGPASSIDIDVTGGDAVFGDLLLSGVDVAMYDGIPPAPTSGNAAYDSTDVTSGTVTFNTVSCPNGSTNTIGINILSIKGDALFENDETIELTLSNAQSCALGSQTTLTITLTNDDGVPTVQFSSASSNSDEGSGIVDIQVELSAVSGTDVTVTFSDAGGSPAADGSDYSVLTSSPLTISAGSTTENIQLSLSDDSNEENDEQVVLTIDGSSVTLGSQTTHTITITDNDGLGDTGPAGVGDNNSNFLWLKADDIMLSDGASVTSWFDASGNGNNVSQSSGTKQPTYQATSNINSGPAVRFNSSQGDELNIADNATLDGMTGLSIYTVFNPTSLAAVNGLVSKRASFSSQESYSMFIYTGQNLFIDIDESNRERGTTTSFSAGTSNIASAFFDGSSSNPRVSMRIDGTSQSMSDGNTGTDNSIPNTSSSLYIGQLGGNSSGYFNGDIAEVILFNTELNDARKIIVENYLSAKYNITVTSDFYAGDTPANGDYDLDVAGIGTTDGTFANTHSSASNSAGLNISQRNASLNAAGEYIFVGHNSLTNGETTSDVDGSTVLKRMQRIWYLDKTGTVDAQLIFDFSDAGLGSTPNSNPSDYLLIRRAGQSGDFSQITTASSVNGDQVIFNLTDGQLPDGYYTLGTVASDTPLPVELVSYTLANTSNGVKLNWATATEVDNLGFILERSTSPNGQFNQVASYQSSDNLKGQGTVSEETNYNYTDYDSFQPGQTYYYRLSDVDLSGKKNVLETKSITRPKAYNLDQNYPNPFNPVTTIQFSLAKPANTVLEVYDMLGRKVTTLINEELSAGSHLKTWNAQGYASGVYFYRLKSGNFTQIKKMMLLK